MLMSLLVAFVIWLASNLSQSYSGVVSVPIIAESNIDGHSRESSTSSTVTARCHMSGYNLLRRPYGRGRKSQKVKINKMDLHRASEDVFFISGSSLNAYSDQIFGEGTTVDAFVYIMHEDRPFGVPSPTYVATCMEGYADFEFDEQLLEDAFSRSMTEVARQEEEDRA